MDDIITEDSRRDENEVYFEVYCPYCKITSVHSKKDIKKRFSFGLFGAKARYSVDCPVCEHKLLISTNISR